MGTNSRLGAYSNKYSIARRANNKDTKGAIESVRIEGVSVLSGLNLEKKGFLSPRTKQTVYNNEVSILSGCP